LGGWKIFIDGNSNNKFDKGEKLSFSDSYSLKSYGHYALTNLPLGIYQICEVMPLFWTSSLPNSSNCQQVILDSTEVSEVNFGNYLNFNWGLFHF
jgi:hypothetical protein